MLDAHLQTTLKSVLGGAMSTVSPVIREYMSMVLFRISHLMAVTWLLMAVTGAECTLVGSNVPGACQFPSCASQLQPVTIDGKPPDCRSRFFSFLTAPRVCGTRYEYSMFAGH